MEKHPVTFCVKPIEYVRESVSCLQNSWTGRKKEAFGGDRSMEVLHEPYDGDNETGKNES